LGVNSHLRSETVSLPGAVGVRTHYCIRRSIL